MTLVASSPLFYWDARYGPIPIIGGKPSHARNGPATWFDEQGVMQSAIVNTPRFEWATVNGERRQLLRLEPGRSNFETFSEQTDNAAWLKTTGGGGTAPVVTADQGIAPDGTLTAEKVVFVAPVSGDASSLNSASFTTTAAAKYAGGIYLKAFATADVGKTILIRHVGGAGYTALVLTEQWQRATSVETAAGVSSSLEISLRPAFASSTGTVTVLAWGAHVELGASISSYVKTPSSSGVSRTADVFSWQYTSLPQAAMIYTSFIDRGTGLDQTTSPRIWQIGKADGSDPQLVLYHSTHYQLLHSVSASAVTSTMAGSPVYGDWVRLLSIVYSDGSVELIQSINGAAVTSGGRSAVKAFGAAWSDTVLWLNSLSAGAIGLADFAQLKIVKFADVVASTPQGRMDELDAFEMNAASEVIVAGS
jgi:hypothetical protein